MNDIYKTLSNPYERVQYDRSIADATDTFTIGQSEVAHSGAYRYRSERRSEHTGSGQTHQTTHNDAEVEESWCEILADLTVKVVGAAIGTAIGVGIVWLVFRLWDPWD